jgi:hypothetical protein
MLLASASAQAAGSRSLSLASADDPAAAQHGTTTPAAPPATEAAKPADAPKYVDRPSAVSTTAPAAATTTAPAMTQAPATTAAKPAPHTTAKADKPRRKRYWTEGRIISELHRHGIYW